ncbi:uncharacterized protein LOC136040163 [Artemia franciscana]|uniref:Uncharacterized protein n=1 Tax=Artemia franciscana TaxID=6661 RepID=A0AA88HUQ3_ARTSF|nr:hypothetical protein QYM36_008700 [Artemia franciscana]KAK2714219.1 hypothetical protein QYM36_008700 [Artemia franciscana]KAK2714220.1 hypothetical protein QYM36_008700 [Artemia franciscana]
MTKQRLFSIFKPLLIFLCLTVFYIYQFGAKLNVIVHSDINEIERNLGITEDEMSCKEKGIGKTGGFCLDEDNILVGGNKLWGPEFAKGMENIFKNSSVLDLGAGLGHYGRYFLRKREYIFEDKFRDIEKSIFFDRIEDIINTPKRILHYEGYDGALNIEKVTSGFIKHIDLAAPQNLNRKFDWVMSVEVGEHIPMEYESIYISNMIKHACKGIILTWAVEGQGGHFHVNNHNNSYVRERMETKGWKTCDSAEEYLRDIADLGYLKNTIMFFVPKSMPPKMCPYYKPFSCE